MKTALLYLDDPYQKSMQATVIDVIPESAAIWRLVLDQTVFYPKGGGQPTDQGVLEFADGIKGEVQQVLLKDGQVQHFVKMSREPIAGERVTGTIDWNRRFHHMRLHSAGHVIDFAMYLLGYSPNKLQPLKGDHGKKPYIVYGGKLDKEIREELQQKVDELIAKQINFSWSFQPLDVLKSVAIYLQPNLPIHKPLRALSLEGVGSVADGGTIVSNTREVGSVTIGAVKLEGNDTHVLYQVS